LAVFFATATLPRADLLASCAEHRPKIHKANSANKEQKRLAGRKNVKKIPPERRFCVLDVDTRCEQNHDYFGKITSIVDRSFSFAEAAAVHRHIEGRANIGKDVLLP